jgi:hypothetical protein
VPQPCEPANARSDHPLTHPTWSWLAWCAGACDMVVAVCAWCVHVLLNQGTREPRSRACAERRACAR